MRNVFGKFEVHVTPGLGDAAKLLFNAGFTLSCPVHTQYQMTMCIQVVGDELFHSELMVCIILLSHAYEDHLHVSFLQSHLYLLTNLNCDTNATIVHIKHIKHTQLLVIILK